MPIHTYLDLSTGHLTAATRDKLDYTPHPEWPAMSIASYEFGWFLTVPVEDLHLLPDDLCVVMRLAKDLGIAVVRFDADGDVHQVLPYYQEV